MNNQHLNIGNQYKGCSKKQLFVAMNSVFGRGSWLPSQFQLFCISLNFGEDFVEDLLGPLVAQALG